MTEKYKNIFSRNWGFLTEEEQTVLRCSCVGIAGVGGVGGLMAERLIRIGIGSMKITDLDVFEESNLNRQFGSSIKTLGEKKTGVICRDLADINPEARIYLDHRGITDAGDAKDFVDGCDVVVDAMDTQAFKQSIMVQRECRRAGKYYLFSTALGFGALAAVFDPEGQTLEEYNGLPADFDLQNLDRIVIDFQKAIPVFPSYIKNVTAETLSNIFKGLIPVPANSIGAGLAALMGTIQVVNILLKKKDLIVAPHYIYLDILDNRLVIGKINC